VVLPALVHSKEVQKVHIKRTLSAEEMEHHLKSMSKTAQRARAGALSSTIDTWLWKPVDHRSPTAATGDNPEGSVKEVDMREDWSHLNRRRQRSREEALEREGKWMRKLQRVKEGRLDTTLASQTVS
jgi:hypothetical protein